MAYDYCHENHGQQLQHFRYRLFTLPALNLHWDPLTGYCCFYAHLENCGSLHNKMVITVGTWEALMWVRTEGFVQNTCTSHDSCACTWWCWMNLCHSFSTPNHTKLEPNNAVCLISNKSATFRVPNGQRAKKCQKSTVFQTIFSKTKQQFLATTMKFWN